MTTACATLKLILGVLPPTPNLEASYAYRIGQSDAIYQRGNRIRLDNYQIQQHKIEIKGSNYFIRSYLTIENTTDSYNLGPAGGVMDKSFKDDNTWYADYKNAYNTIYNANNGVAAAEIHRQARVAADQGRYQPGTGGLLTPSLPSWPQLTIGTRQALARLVHNPLIVCIIPYAFVDIVKQSDNATCKGEKLYESVFY